MITHVLKDGSRVESITGKVICSKEFPVLYRMLEGGDFSDKPVSTSDRCSEDYRKSEQNSFLLGYGSLAR